MFSMKRASSAVRLPRVFAWSSASRSIDCCAIARLGALFSPLVGSGASPRWTIADEPSESTKALKSSFGSSAMRSPQVEGEFLQPVPALDEQHRLPALARLRQR